MVISSRMTWRSLARTCQVASAKTASARIRNADCASSQRWLGARRVLASPDADDQLLAVNEALDKLAAQDPVEAELVKLRYFVGLTNDEAASLLDISPRTARNYWAHARTWLYQEIVVRGH